MKIKISIIVLAVIAALSKVSAQGSLESKKMRLGLGLSSFWVGSGIGGNLKFDYLLNDKFSFGVNTMFSTNQAFEDYSFPADQYSPGIKVDYSPGNAKAFCLTANYYIIGKNNNESKFGFYLGSGLSYADYNFSSTANTILATNDPKYYQYDKFSTEKSFSMVGTIGVDFKLGSGKIFLDLVNNVALYETSTDNFSNVKNAPVVAGSNKYSQSFTFSNYEFLNLGYQLYF